MEWNTIMVLPVSKTCAMKLLWRCWCQALIDATSPENSLEDEVGVRMVALFDHEEVGSNSAQGAGSPVMFDALSRITSTFSPDSKVVQ